MSRRRKTRGSLKLTSREAVLQGGDTGPAAVPGKPDDSLLVQLVRRTDKTQMPKGDKLSGPRDRRSDALGGNGPALPCRRGNASGRLPHHRRATAFLGVPAGQGRRRRRM